MTKGIVLSGGGTKGAFEAGAMKYVLGVEHFYPEVLAGTSAGSLMAGVIGQARTPHEFDEINGVLHDNMLAMTRTEVVFGKQSWLAEFDGTPVASIIDSFMADRGRPAIPVDDGLEDDPLHPRFEPPPRRKHRRWTDLTAMAAQLPAALRAKSALRDDKTVRSSILTLDPMERALRGHANSGIHAIDEGAIARPGLAMRLGIASLNSGVMRYVTEDGTVVNSDALTPHEAGGRPGVVTGMIASSSVPMVFPPRRIGDDVYTDGGVLQNIPLGAAIRCGADDILTVLALPAEFAYDDTDYTKTDFMRVYIRATSDLAFMDQSAASLSHPLPVGGRNRVIAPTVDVVGPFEVAQGLMLIDMDYGWMRAAEVMADADDDTRRQAVGLSDAATIARERAWYLEERLIGGDRQTDVVSTVRRCKDQARTAVDAWIALGFPPPAGHENWGHVWENHQAAPPSALTSRALLPTTG